MTLKTLIRIELGIRKKLSRKRTYEIRKEG
jgi:hypothetical protein